MRTAALAAAAELSVGRSLRAWQEVGFGETRFLAPYAMADFLYFHRALPYIEVFQRQFQK
jgi:hypothetical protein